LRAGGCRIESFLSPAEGAGRSGGFLLSSFPRRRESISFQGAAGAGEGFKIEPQEPDDQDLFLARDAHWSWRVTALPAAMHRLILTTYVQTPETAGGPLKPMWTRSKTVEVSVSVPPMARWTQWTKSVGDWAKTTQGMIVSLTALVAAIAGLIAALRALFKPKPAKGEDSPPGGD